MSCFGIPCANKTDVGVFVTYAPLSALMYACCYIMLVNMNPRIEQENANFVTYGFMQCSIGFLTGYCTSRWIYYQNKRPSRRPQPAEEAQLLITPPPPSADTEEIDAT